MFTSRAEYRLILREDNADLRLTTKGRELGLVDDARWQQFETKREAIEQEQQRLRDTWIQPDKLNTDDAQRVFGKPLAREYRLMELLSRPDVSYDAMRNLPVFGSGVTDPVVAEQVETQAKYAGYIDRQHDEIARHRRHEETALPEKMDYAKVSGLSNEVSQKLTAQQPQTIGHASRIPGVTPAAISLLLVHLKKKNLYAQSA